MQVIFNWDIAGGTLRREMAVVAMCNIASGAYVMKVFNKSGASVLVFLDNVSEGYPVDVFICRMVPFVLVAQIGFQVWYGDRLIDPLFDFIGDGFVLNNKLTRG